MIDYKKLMQYCKTDRQREVLEAVITEQSQSKASVKLGISRGTMSNIMNAIYKHQRKEDNAAYEDAPIGYQVKGVSTLYVPMVKSNNNGSKQIETKKNKKH